MKINVLYLQHYFMKHYQMYKSKELIMFLFN